jgi:glutamate-ammonia-ligase adenylyltransferase
MAVSLSCSPALQALLDSRLEQLRERAPRTCALLDPRPELMPQLRKVLCGSDFVQRAFMRDDGLLESLWQSGALAVPRSREDYGARVSALEAEHAASEAQFGKALRQLRRAEMVRLVWRDLTGAASLHDTLRETSWLAESAIAGACRVAAALLALRHGAPPADAGGLVVLGMGKLGGEELNFSSDVDLVFLYPRGGETAGPVPLALEDYYTRQGQLLIRLLDDVSEEGFVFRVDMRLRPFGDTGPRLGTLRLHQGTTTDAGAGLRCAAPGCAAAIRVPPLPGLRRVRILARNEGADRAGRGAARPRCKSEAGCRRNP